MLQINVGSKTTVGRGCQYSTHVKILTSSEVRGGKTTGIQKKWQWTAGKHTHFIKDGKITILQLVTSLIFYFPLMTLNRCVKHGHTIFQSFTSEVTYDHFPLHYLPT